MDIQAADILEENEREIKVRWKLDAQVYVLTLRKCRETVYDEAGQLIIHAPNNKREIRIYNQPDDY